MFSVSVFTGLRYTPLVPPAATASANWLGAFFNIEAISSPMARFHNGQDLGKADIFRAAKNINTFILFPFKILIKVLAHCVRTDVYVSRIRRVVSLILFSKLPFAPQQRRF
jgi:hypothetical protein